MTIERLEEIFYGTDSKWEGDNALQGLNLISKYFPDKTVLTGARHDVIFSVGVEELAEVISEEDCFKLALLNWSTEHEYLICYV